MLFSVKVEKKIKGSLDSIPSPLPSVKIQIMGGKVCLRCEGKTKCWQQTFENKIFVDITQQCFVLLLQVNFPANNPVKLSLKMKVMGLNQGCYLLKSFLLYNDDF